MQHDRPRTLVMLDREDCGIDAFERFLADKDPDSIDLRVVVRAMSSSPEDIERAQGLLREATIVAQKRRFTRSGWAIVLTPHDLEAELSEVEQFDDAVIIMPESAWPTAKSARYRRSAKRYGALVQFDCISE
jgi:hypothetical protein